MESDLVRELKISEHNYEETNRAMDKLGKEIRDFRRLAAQLVQEIEQFKASICKECKKARVNSEGNLCDSCAEGEAICRTNVGGQWAMNWLEGAQLTEEQNDTLGEVLKLIDISLLDCKEHKLTLVNAEWQIEGEEEGIQYYKDWDAAYSHNEDGSIKLDWVDYLADMIKEGDSIQGLPYINGPHPVIISDLGEDEHCDGEGDNCDGCCACLLEDGEL